MSGIAGLIRLDCAPLDSHCLHRALAVLARRGPDRQRSVVDDNAAFGQTLLATTPEALNEVQPWTHPDSGCTIVADSRLDNRPELLQQLGLRDRHVDSIGDAELLHAAWQRWGEACPIRLLGDFAFAIWNPRTQSLFCARDPMGVRQLLYCHLPGQLFAFATEADALLRMAGVPHTLNEGRIADVILDLEGIDHASTMFEAIARLPGAHILSVDQSTRRITRYWTPTDDLVDTQYTRDEDYAEAMRGHLAQAVHCRLRSNDVVGSMLSGGLDSSAIAALASLEMQHATGASLPSFSTVDRSQPCPETGAVDAMLAQSGFVSHPFDVADSDADWATLAAEQERLLEPFDWGMGLLRAHYLSANRVGVRAMLDGIDADGLFNSGNFHRRLMRSGRWDVLWQEVQGQSRFHNGLFSTLSLTRSDLAQVLVPQWLLLARARLQAPRRLRRRLCDALISSEFATRACVQERIGRLVAGRGYPAGADRQSERVL
ncbi:MAG: asparagine synthase-related protein, partial [Lysobacteraceae bacterium]